MSRRKRSAYLGGSTIVRRSPLFVRGVSEPGPNVAEGEEAVARAAAKKRAKVVARIDAMNRGVRR